MACISLTPLPLTFQNKRRWSTFYLPKLFITGAIWAMAVILSSWQEFNELNDPTYNYKLDSGGYLVSFWNYGEKISVFNEFCEFL